MRTLAVIALGVLGGLAWSGCSKDVSTGRRGPLPGHVDNDGRAGAGGDLGNAGTSAGAAGTVDTGSNALSVRVEDVEGLELELITLSCAGDCAEVMAVASGGHAPYAFEWEDGSKSAARTVCLDASKTLEISVTDTSFESDEFSYEAKTVSKQISADVVGCDDGGVAMPDAGPCLPLDIDDPPVVIGDVTPDIASNTPALFADGEDLPAGAYMLEYVDGCLRYDPTIYNWAVNGFETFEYVAVGNFTSGQSLPAPVTESLFGAATFEECVALSLMDPPSSFEFEGGPISIYNNDFNPDDNTPGPEGRNPTFRLTRIGCGDTADF